MTERERGEGERKGGRESGKGREEKEIDNLKTLILRLVELTVLTLDV